jgi:hypothetical protein
MSTEETIAFFGAVVVWDAFCLQLLIIPFMRKRETLQRDYITSGILDAALSFIETTRLIPALAAIFVRIREAQDDRRRKLEEDELEEILQEIDYIPDLERAQGAMDENNKLKALFDSLQNSTGRIWGVGLLHVIIMLGLPVCQWMAGGYDLVALIGATILAIITFVGAICGVMLFQKQMRQFLDLLKQNRSVG